MQTRVRRAFQIAALQSDGYRSSLSRLLPSGRKNVYMYIDNELDDVDHLCCMAHARAKFKYAYEQGGDERALSFLKGPLGFAASLVEEPFGAIRQNWLLT